MAVKIEIMTTDDAHKKFGRQYPLNKILGIAKRIDRLLDILDAPIAIRIHTVKRSAPVTRGNKIELEYTVDHEISQISKRL